MGYVETFWYFNSTVNETQVYIFISLFKVYQFKAGYKFYIYLISHNKATPRRIQNSGGLIVCNQSGVINSTYVLCGFLYTGHYEYHESINKFKVFNTSYIFS